KLILEPTPETFIELESLRAMIPENRHGRPLNIGQGEGQFKIDETVWGVYFDEAGRYYIQFEEGKADLVQFQKILSDIVSEVRKTLLCEITVHGMFQGSKTHGNYLADKQKT